MLSFGYIFVGGGLGACMRHGLVTLLKHLYSTPFPIGTLVVNVIGSLAMGALMAWVMKQPEARDGARMLLATGVLGGFTTFSAFSWDVLQLWQRGEVVPALIYVLASVMLSLLAVLIGYVAMQQSGVM